MTDIPGLIPAPVVHRAMRRKGRIIAGLMAAQTTFETAPVPQLTLDFDGIPGDCHFGATRKAGGREPWYPRGMAMRNDRALSLVAPDDMRAIAQAMDMASIRPEWLGANLVIDGIAHFSCLPAGTRLVCEGGAVLVVSGQNRPCRHAGAAIAAHYPDRSGLDLLFAQKAKGLRGLVACVEKPGVITDGEAVEARIPEQWIYAG
ncbi:MAG: MOSC domain-containing protein [Beijerinckiaceae bacterium]